MSTLNLLYQKSYAINDQIHVLIPTVREIMADEDSYNNAVSIITAQPVEFMVLLDDAGIDFTTLSDWELFLLLFPMLARIDTHLILEGLEFKDFSTMIDTENGQIVLFNKAAGVRIDKQIHAKIAATLRQINHMERDHRKPANEEAKKYMIERARIKAKRRKNRAEKSQMEVLIVALVNTEQYKYDFTGTLDLTVYQFHECVRQIIKKVDYDNHMHGVYAGTVNPKNLKPDELNWMVH